MNKTDESVYALLTRVSTLAKRAAADLLFELGVSPFELWLLEAIPEDCDASASELAAMLEVPTSTVTRALRRLEACRYVELQKGLLFDARVLRARVTDYGRNIRSNAAGFEHDIDRVLLEGLAPQSAGVVVHALVHMHDRLAARLARFGR